VAWTVVNRWDKSKKAVVTVVPFDPPVVTSILLMMGKVV
jgi:hypothetical protein